MARRSGRKSDFTWQGLSGATAAVLTNAARIDAVNTPSVASTLMRSRGEVLASIDGPTDGDSCVAIFGLIVGTEEQVSIGATAFPDPANDMDAEWIWYGSILLFAQAGTGLGASLNALSVVGRLTIDSKAMRRMKQTQSVVMVTRNLTLAGTPAVDVNFAIRQLFAE